MEKRRAELIIDMKVNKFEDLEEVAKKIEQIREESKCNINTNITIGRPY